MSSQRYCFSFIFISFSQTKNRDLDDMLSSLGVAPVSEVLSSYSSVQSNSSDGPQSIDTESQQTATIGRQVNFNAKFSYIYLNVRNLLMQCWQTKTCQLDGCLGAGNGHSPERDSRVHETDPDNSSWNRPRT